MVHYLCLACGAEHDDRPDVCFCGQRSFDEVEPSLVGDSLSPLSGQQSVVVPLDQAGDAEDENRILTYIEDIDRVLGGGLVESSVVLISGDPGAGKSTLSLELGSALIASGVSPVLYASGEETAKQIQSRAKRLGVEKTSDLLVLATCEYEDVENAIRQHNPGAVIIDSMQVMRVAEIDAPASSPSQVREVVARLVRVAKQETRTVIIIAHINKDGVIAGPKVVEHLVDVVLFIEHQKSCEVRVIRQDKNRFGDATEIALMEMCDEGLVPVSTEALIADRPIDAPGAIIVPVLEGSRPRLVLLQALVTISGGVQARRMGTGIDGQRLQQVAAVLAQHTHLELGARDILVAVAGGALAEEPAADLGMAIAICSQMLDRVVPPDVVALGEIGLSGEIRPVARTNVRLQEASRLGFAVAMMPRSKGAKVPDGLDVIEVKTLGEVVQWVKELPKAETKDPPTPKRRAKNPPQ